MADSMPEDASESRRKSESSGPSFRVTEWDREYFRRLGEFERANDAQMKREHFARSLEERLMRSARRSAEAIRNGEFVNDVDDDLEVAKEFYERAKRLGLYRA